MCIRDRVSHYGIHIAEYEFCTECGGLVDYVPWYNECNEIDGFETIKEAGHLIIMSDKYNMRKHLRFDIAVCGHKVPQKTSNKVTCKACSNILSKVFVGAI